MAFLRPTLLISAKKSDSDRVSVLAKQTLMFVVKTRGVGHFLPGEREDECRWVIAI